VPPFYFLLYIKINMPKLADLMTKMIRILLKKLNALESMGLYKGKTSWQSVFYCIPSLFCVHPRLIFISFNNRTRKNKPQMNADERRFVNLNTDALFFASWYEIKLTTNTTNSIRTHATGVRFSSYKFVVFFMYIYEPQFMADFAVKILYPPNRSTDTNLKENTFFSTQSIRSTPTT
jgi:hypothetical protein